ncbi:MAG TPA: HAD-IA family hydrolase, partial [Rhodothermales bacterium]
AARALNVQPERCVVIEDAPAGIASANAAGMRSIAVASTYPADALAGATVVIEQLSDLRVELGPGIPYRLMVRLP